MSEFWRAECDCGWQGPRRACAGCALDDKRAHEEANPGHVDEAAFLAGGE